MRILFYASHLLHHRSLIPVMCELSSRGREIVVQTTRPDWLGMPTWQMNWRPTKVTGINRTSLAWLAQLIGYAPEWAGAQPRMQYSRLAGWESADWYPPHCVVSTTKDVAWLRRHQNLLVERVVAIGYQHFPIVMEVGAGPYTWQDMPQPFWYEEPFAKAHEFEGIMAWGRGRGCGFPHLDKIPKASTPSMANIVAIQHHGGYRGLAGHRWIRRLVRIVRYSGFRPHVILHPIPGFGYGERAVHRAVDREGAIVRRSQWPVAHDATYILTTGSSSAYDYWSVGLKNVYILTYLGGGRDKAFHMFSDICINSEDELKLLLTGKLGRGNYPPTKAVMDAFDAVHTGQGAKTAADVIEGKR